MARFIPIEKMKKLRESAKAGDERAKAILRKQMLGEEDFSSDLDEYFKPVEEKPAMETSTQEVAEKNPNVQSRQSHLQEFLEYNGITKESPDYDDFVKSYYEENPDEPREDEQAEQVEEHLLKDELDKLKKEEVEAIEDYSKAITIIMNSNEADENAKRRIIARLKEIRSDEEEHFRELGELISGLDNQEDKVAE